MRITNSMLHRGVVRHINKNLAGMAKAQEQMASGRVVNRPADDPGAVARIMSLQTILAENDQYQRNMENAQGWVDAAEQALALAADTLQRARELAVSGANGSLPNTSLEALATEVEELTNELVETANLSYGGRYLFAGSLTTAPPFSRTGAAVIYTGDDAALNWEVTAGVTMTVNVDGGQAFMAAVDGDGDGSLEKSAFALMDELRAALLSGDQGAVEATIDEFGAAIDHLLDARAMLGARSNRLQLALGRLQETQVSLTSTLSQLADIDLAEAVTAYQNRENVYQAALATGAMVLQPSLIDYLS